VLHEIPRVLIRELPRGRPLGIVEGIVKGIVEKDKSNSFWVDAGVTSENCHAHSSSCSLFLVKPATLLILIDLFFSFWWRSCMVPGPFLQFMWGVIFHSCVVFFFTFFFQVFSTDLNVAGLATCHITHEKLTCRRIQQQLYRLDYTQPF